MGFLVESEGGPTQHPQCLFPEDILFLPLLTKPSAVGLGDVQICHPKGKNQRFGLQSTCWQMALMPLNSTGIN